MQECISLKSSLLHVQACAMLYMLLKALTRLFSCHYYLNNLVVHSDVLKSEVHADGEGEIGVKLVLAFLLEDARLAHITVTCRHAYAHTHS